MKVGTGVAVGTDSSGNSVGASVATTLGWFCAVIVAVAFNSDELSALNTCCSAAGEIVTRTGGGAVGEGVIAEAVSVGAT